MESNVFYNDPFQSLRLWQECIKKEALSHRFHLAIRGDPNCPEFFPGVAQPTKKQCMESGSYFGPFKEKGKDAESIYDRCHHLDFGYDQMLKREHRKKVKDRDFSKEDHARKVPVRTSSIYGHLIPDSPLLPAIEKDTQYRYRSLVAKDFMRNNGTGLKLDMARTSNISLLH